MAKQFRVLRGIDYPPLKRAEPGDVVADIPKESIPWLIESGDIEPVPGKPKKESDD